MKEVYTLDDLASRAVLDAGEEKAARLAVLGWPIAHSASPRMHQAALDAVGIDVRYIRLEVEPGRIPEAFDRMRNLGFIGCNVTVPHKLDAMENCTDVDPHAAALGAVNTVCFDGDSIRGFNTDGPGFARSVTDEFGVSLESLNVAIAGAGGGAGQAIATQCAMLGVAKLVIANRSVGKLDVLAKRLVALGIRTQVVALPLASEALAGEFQSCDLIVNTSSVGLKEGDPSILPLECLKAEHLVYDTIYQPAVTPLLGLADRAGCSTCNGFSMLLHQGALAFQHWFPGTNPIEAMRAGLA